MRSESFLADAPLVVRSSPRARRLRLKVDPRTGTVLLTVPPRVSERRALAWAETQRAWIDAALAGIPEGVSLGAGAVFPLEGVPHRIEWSAERPRRIERVKGRILAGGPADSVEARVLRWLRVRALDLLNEETRIFAQRAGKRVAKVGVGDPVSRWGSCSSGGAIRYSWRLILAPAFVRRATVAHEVAHLVHMHHGPEFHALVERILGEDPGPARAWLRREGAALHRIGRSR